MKIIKILFMIEAIGWVLLDSFFIKELISDWLKGKRNAKRV